MEFFCGKVEREENSYRLPVPGNRAKNSENTTICKVLEFQVLATGNWKPVTGN